MSSGDEDYEEPTGFVVTDRELLGPDSETQTPTSEGVVTDEQLKVAHSIVRVVMAREVRGLLIKREHFNEAYTERTSMTRRIKFDTIFPIVQNILETVYGLQLVRVPSKVSVGPSHGRKRKAIESNSETSSKNSNSSNGNSASNNKVFALVSVLPTTAKSVLGEIWATKCTQKVPNGRNISDRQYFLPKNIKTSTPSSNSELIKTGIIALVISIVIVHENRLSEADLKQKLSKFGLSESIHERNTSINMTTMEFLGEMTKREYLNREVTTMDANLADYKLGRRSLAEFKPGSMFDMLERIYGTEFDVDTRNRTLRTIERAYGEAVTDSKLSETMTSERNTPQVQ
ncbi:hypothetical protein CAAN1_06S02102 [[Candida] anglica]|uniref:MAGE domain-containing protein n=1 Tax=[Candida] anglica TaxID=148631 RepID=A0ABP0EMM8_9ASCO